MSDVDVTKQHEDTRDEVTAEYERRRMQFDSDMLDVCESAQGQRVIAWFIEQSGMFRAVFNEFPRRSAFDEGMRSAGHLFREAALKTGLRNWQAIEAEFIKRTTPPKAAQKTKEP